MTVHTANEYKYKLLVDDLTRYTAVTIQLRDIQNDAHIALSKDKSHDSQKYEIVLGGWGGTMSVIRDRNQGSRLATYKHTKSQFLNWSGTIKVYFGEGSIIVRSLITDSEIIRLTNSGIHKENLRYMMVSTGWGASGSWVVSGREPGTGDYSDYTVIGHEI